MPQHSSPAQYAILLIDLVNKQGGDATAVLKNTSYEQVGLAGIGLRVKETDFIQMLANAYQQTNDPALGLHLGEKLNLSAHAVLGQAFLTCDTLAMVIELFLKYYHILSPTLEVEYHVAKGHCYFRPSNEDSGLSDLFGYEIFTAAVKNTFGAMLGRQNFPFYFDFDYPAPKHVEEYYQVLGDNLRFDQAITQLSFDEELLQLKLPSSNSALLTLYEQECQRLLADIEGEDTIAEQSLGLLRKFEGHYPQMDQAAQLLNTSPRTYRRRLAAEGVSFQELLNRVRVEHADYYLTKTSLPLFTIALTIGFNDSSNFRRAYKSWTGKTPQQVRSEFT